MSRKMNISSWHAISTNKGPIKMEGVRYEDLKSIILGLYNNKSVKNLRERLDELYVHLSNFDNPHEVDVGQFEFGILDVLYEKWLQEGYKGEKKDLLDILFNYVEYCTLEELKKGESYIKVTPVKVVHDFIEEHKNGLSDSHTGLFERMFLGECSKRNTEPVLSLMNYLGMPKEVWRKYDKESEEYRNVKFKSLKGGLGDEFSVILKVRYKDKDYLKIKSDDGCEVVFRVSKEQKKFKLIWNGLDNHIRGLVQRKKNSRNLVNKFNIEKNRESRKVEKELMKNRIAEIYEAIENVEKETEEEWFGFKGYNDQGIGNSVFKNLIDSEDDGWFGFKNQVRDVFGDGVFRSNERIEGDWFGFRKGVENVFGECPFQEEIVDVHEWFGFKRNTLNVFGEGVFRSEVKDDNDVFFGFRGYTRNVFGEAIFKTNIEWVYPVDPDDPDDVYFGYYFGTCNVFGEAPFYTEISDEEEEPPVFPPDPDYTYVLDLEGIESEWITIVVSVKNEKIRLYCESERKYDLPITKVVGEAKLMRYPIVPVNPVLDIARMGNRGTLFKDKLFNDDDNRILEIYKGWFNEKELEYIFNCYR